MLATLFIALFIGGSTANSLETDCGSVRRVPPDWNNAVRKITARKDRLFGHLIGKSKAHVRRCQGEPDKEKLNAWTYVEKLTPGMRDSWHSWVVKFQGDQVVEVEVRSIGGGCIRVPPPPKDRIP
jgi:hypothetical protein